MKIGLRSRLMVGVLAVVIALGVAACTGDGLGGSFGSVAQLTGDPYAKLYEQDVSSYAGTWLRFGANTGSSPVNLSWDQWDAARSYPNCAPYSSVPATDINNATADGYNVVVQTSNAYETASYPTAAQMQCVYAAMLATINPAGHQVYIEPWNEPDCSTCNTADGVGGTGIPSDTAFTYYLLLEQAISDAGASSWAHPLAGAFASGLTASYNECPTADQPPVPGGGGAYINRYICDMQESHQDPASWSFHDYADLDAAAVQECYFTGTCGNDLGEASDFVNTLYDSQMQGTDVWASELGDNSQFMGKPHTPAEDVSAAVVAEDLEFTDGPFSNAAGGHYPMVDHELWYQFNTAAPDSGWDSALTVGSGPLECARASYFYFLNQDATDDVNPSYISSHYPGMSLCAN